MLAHDYEYVIGGDPDRDTVDLAVLDTATGGVRAHLASSADGAGYSDMLEWARQHAPGRRVWALEGTGSFAAGLSDALAQAGEDVVEVGGVKRVRGAKSDRIDAVRAARTALGAVLFGFFDAAQIRLQGRGMPAELVQTLPYIIVIVVLVGLGALCIFGGWPVAGLAMQGLSLLLAGLAVWQALTGLAGDLVEARRRLRVILAIGAGLYIAAITLAELMPHHGGEGLPGTTLNAAGLAAMPLPSR